MSALIRRSILFGSCLGLFPLYGQESTPSQPEESPPSQQEGSAVPNPTPAVLPSDVRVVGEIPDGSPSAPAEPKPRLVFQPDDVIASRYKELGERVVTFQKVAPIELPPLPEPASAEGVLPDTEALAQAREEYQKRRFVFLGASAYVSTQNPDQPRSYVRIWPSRPNAEPIGIWVNANFLWLTGFAEVEAGDTIYSLLMAISSTEVDNPAKVAAKLRRDSAAPEAPEFDDTQASFVVAEGSPTEEDLAPIRALVALYNKDKERLRLAYQGRMEAAEERARELRENPPAKKNIVVRYWRLDQAGQNGATPKPADIR